MSPVLLLASIALAQDPAGPDDLLHLARERARNGDYEGARLVADEAGAIPGPHQHAARYLVALAVELGGDPARALGLYDALLVEQPDDEDVRFRRAECLAALGRYREARAALDDLGTKGRPEVDRLKIRLLEATWDLELGRVRKGLVRLERELEGADPAVAVWYQGLARHAVLVHATSTADALAFAGSDRAKERALEERAALIALAERELAALVRLDADVTGFALDGFARLGGSYEDLGDDMLTESPLTRLSETQQALNRDLLLEKVERVWVKGALYFDAGTQLAANRRWTVEPVPTLHAAHDALLARVEGLRPSAPPPPAPVAPVAPVDPVEAVLPGAVP